MSKTLVIVESPRKARTINAWLGPDYIVEATKGHIKDLPQHELGIDIANDFHPTFLITRQQRDTVARMRQLAALCSRVLIATDPDREGEAIAQHVYEVLQDSCHDIQRVMLSEITRAAVVAALKSPTTINSNLVQAQYARRASDRLLSQQAARIIGRDSKSLKNVSPVGRVQAATLILLAQREREIADTLSVRHYDVVGSFAANNGQVIRARLTDSQPIHSQSSHSSHAGAATPNVVTPSSAFTAMQAAALADEVRAGSYSIIGTATRRKAIQPPPLFTTAWLLAYASMVLDLTVEQTMDGLQSLYEGVRVGKDRIVGLISYPRTSSQWIHDDVLDQAKQVVYELYGAEYVRASTTDSRQTTKGSRRLAPIASHGAIHPTDMRNNPSNVRKSLPAIEFALYEAIHRRVLTNVMPSATTLTSAITISNGAYTFVAEYGIIKANGWVQADPHALDGYLSTGSEMGSLHKHQALTLVGVEVVERASSSARYTDGTLVTAISERAIGTPGTYASTIAQLLQSHFVKREGRELIPTMDGVSISDSLSQHMPHAFHPNYAMNLERELDKIASGRESYASVMKRIYKPIAKLNLGRANKMDRATRIPEREQMLNRIAMNARETKGTTMDGSAVKCPDCGAPMTERSGAHGSFLGCSRFPKCRCTVAIEMHAK